MHIHAEWWNGGLGVLLLSMNHKFFFLFLKLEHVRVRAGYAILAVMKI